MHAHVELFWQLLCLFLCLLLYLWSYQHSFPFKQTKYFEVVSPLTPWTIEKLSRVDNKEKGMHVMFERAGTVMCHNFGCQLKLTGTITCMCERHGYNISGKNWTAIVCIKSYSVYTWRKWMGSNQMPHATMVYDSWFLPGVCKDEVDIQRKLETTGCLGHRTESWDRENTRNLDSLACCSWSKCLEL